MAIRNLEKNLRTGLGFGRQTHSPAHPAEPRARFLNPARIWETGFTRAEIGWRDLSSIAINDGTKQNPHSIVTGAAKMNLMNTISSPTVASTGRPVRPGRKEEIAFAIAESELGLVLVAQSFDGICAILIGSDASELERDLAARFPDAGLTRNDEKLECPMKKVLRFIEDPAQGRKRFRAKWAPVRVKKTRQYNPGLWLDIRGTLFQRRVWAELCNIPAGQMITYAALAARLGEPKAVRAVASACAANAIALAIPCHRVVRSNGTLSGYRWGVERKRALLEKEAGK